MNKKKMIKRTTALFGSLIFSLTFGGFSASAQAPWPVAEADSVLILKVENERICRAAARKNSRYWGFYRRNVKTSAVRDKAGVLLPTTEYGNMKNLLAALPSDSAMRAQHAAFRPPRGVFEKISHFFPEKKQRRARRFPEENRNVGVEGYLFAIKKMNDNDFHLVLLSDSDTSAVGFRAMNVEVAGIRKNCPEKALLTHAREQIIQVCGPEAGAQGWTFFEPPLPLRVTGALFFDGKKERDAMKPGHFRPVTAWEIHPVYSVEIGK